jgi:nitrite reductase/ring-hydroxylating ferredoxin subunit
MMCGTVQCPWHGSQFDVRDGRLRAGPADEGIRTYAVEQDGDRLRLVLPGES